jgi:hypothetical protein
MYKFVKFIVNTHKKKILICNQRNSRLKDFFRADILINIPDRNWSYYYSTYKDIVKKHAENNCVILIAGGMCSKVLVNDITDEFDLTFIDIGSGFDLLGSKIKSRPWKHSYEDELEYYKDFIPKNWDTRKPSDFAHNYLSDTTVLNMIIDTITRKKRGRIINFLHPYIDAIFKSSNNGKNFSSNYFITHVF